MRFSIFNYDFNLWISSCTTIFLCFHWIDGSLIGFNGENCWMDRCRDRLLQEPNNFLTLCIIITVIRHTTESSQNLYNLWHLLKKTSSCSKRSSAWSMQTKDMINRQSYSLTSTLQLCNYHQPTICTFASGWVFPDQRVQSLPYNYSNYDELNF